MDERKVKPGHFKKWSDVPEGNNWRMRRGVPLTLEQINEINRVAHELQFQNEAGIWTPHYGRAREIFESKHEIVTKSDGTSEWQPVSQGRGNN